MVPAYNSGRFPIWAFVELPFMVGDSVAASAAVHEWYAKYAPREMPDVKICLTTMHHPGAVHTVSKQVKVPSDLKGLKLRPAGPTIGLWLNQLGATVVPAPLPEIVRRQH